MPRQRRYPGQDSCEPRGARLGGRASFSRGALYSLLANRLYLGKSSIADEFIPVNTKPSSKQAYGKRSPHSSPRIDVLVVGAVLSILQVY
jgi:hypothetical protein